MPQQNQYNLNSSKPTTRATIPETESPPSSASPPQVDPPFQSEQHKSNHNGRSSHYTPMIRDSRPYRHLNNERYSRPSHHYSSPSLSRNGHQSYSTHRYSNDRSHRSDSPSRHTRNDYYRYDDTYRRYDDRSRRSDRPSYNSYQRDYRPSYDSYDRYNSADTHPSKRMRRYSDHLHNDSSRLDYTSSFDRKDTNLKDEQFRSRSTYERRVIAVTMTNVVSIKLPEEMIDHFKRLRPTQARRKDRDSWTIGFQEPQNLEPVMSLATRLTAKKYIDIVYQNNHRSHAGRSSSKKRPRDDSDRPHSRFQSYEADLLKRSPSYSGPIREKSFSQSRDFRNREQSPERRKASRNRDESRTETPHKTDRVQKHTDRLDNQKRGSDSNAKFRSTSVKGLSNGSHGVREMKKTQLSEDMKNKPYVQPIQNKNPAKYVKIETKDILFNVVLSEFADIVRKDIVQLRSSRYKGTVNKLTKEAIREHQQQKEEEAKKKQDEKSNDIKPIRKKVEKESNIEIPRARPLKVITRKESLLEKHPRQDDEKSPKMPPKRKRLSRFSGTGSHEPETSTISPSSVFQSRHPKTEPKSPRNFSHSPKEKDRIVDSFICSEVSNGAAPSTAEKKEKKTYKESSILLKSREISQRKGLRQGMEESDGVPIEKKRKERNVREKKVSDEKSVSTCDPSSKLIYDSKDADLYHDEQNGDKLAKRVRSHTKAQKLKKKGRKSRIADSDDDRDSTEENESNEEQSRSYNSMEGLQLDKDSGKSVEKRVQRFRRTTQLKNSSGTMVSDKETLPDCPETHTSKRQGKSDRGKEWDGNAIDELEREQHNGDVDVHPPEKVMLRLRIVPPKQNCHKKETDSKSEILQERESLKSQRNKTEDSDTDEDNEISARTAGLMVFNQHDHGQSNNNVRDGRSRKGLPSVESSRENRQQSRRFRKGINHFNMKNDTLTLNSLCQRKKSVYPSNSSIHGIGLYANETIECGEFVIEYIGDVVRPSVADKREIVYTRQGMGDSYLFRLTADTVVDATRKGGIARFINHSCDPSLHAKIITVGMDRKIVFYSNRRILKHEELTYDYKFDFEGEDKKIPCLCGAATCRKYLN